MRTVKMIITCDEHGHMIVETEGPIGGKSGALTLIDEARKLVEQMKP